MLTAEASSNYGAMGQGAIEGFLRADIAMGLGVWEWKPLVGRVSRTGRREMATKEVRTGAGRYELNVELGQHMIFTKLRLLALFLAAVASTIAGEACFAQTQSPKHTIVVTFDYDFTACACLLGKSDQEMHREICCL